MAISQSTTNRLSHIGFIVLMCTVIAVISLFRQNDDIREIAQETKSETLQNREETITNRSETIRNRELLREIQAKLNELAAAEERK